MTKGRIAGAGFAIALALVATWEGLSTKPYRDVIGILTVCYGDTEVEMREYTKAECQDLLVIRLWKYWDAVGKAENKDCPLAPHEQAAFTSLAYNVGIAAFEKSTARRLIQVCQIKAACEQLPRWIRAGGRAMPGLVNRREAERRMCLGKE